MKKCIAYNRSRMAPEAWKPCGRSAESGSVFCLAHGDAVNGAILGLYARGFPSVAGNSAAKKRCRAGKRAGQSGASER